MYVWGIVLGAWNTLVKRKKENIKSHPDRALTLLGKDKL